MYGVKIKILPILVTSFALYCAGLSTVVYGNGGNDTRSREDLFSLARDIARKYGIDADEYDLRIGKEGDLTTVELWPKPKTKDVIQLGNGSTLFFKIENGKYKFIKIMHWQ